MSVIGQYLEQRSDGVNILFQFALFVRGLNTFSTILSGVIQKPRSHEPEKKHKVAITGNETMNIFN